MIGQKGFKNILIVMIGTLGSRFLGLFRNLVINLYDARLTDAFNMASLVPNLFRELLAEGALINSFIPVYKTLEPLERKKLASAFSVALLGINLLFLALGIVFAPQITHLFLATKSNVDYDLAVYFTRLMVPFLTFISMSAVAMGLLNADEHFKESSSGPIALNIVSIVLMLVFLHNPLWLALGYTLGGAAQLAVQIPALRRYGLFPSFKVFTHPALPRVLLLMLPFALSTSGKQFLNIYISNILSGLGKNYVGVVTAFNNAQTLFQLILGLFAISPALALFPRMAGLAAEKDWDGFKALTLQSLKLMIFVAAPISVLVAVLSPQAMSIFNIKGHDPQRFAFGAQILSTWALAVIPWGMNALMVRTFYVRQRTLEPLIITTLGAFADVLLYNLLFPSLGLYCFGLSTTLTGLITSSVLMGLYSRQLGFNWSPLVLHLLKVIPMAMVCAAGAWTVSRFLPAPINIFWGMLDFAIAGGVGGAAYLGLAYLLRFPEMRSVVARIKR